MILLFGGTTEGKKVAAWLDNAGLPYIYSTRSKTAFEGRGSYRYGALDQAALKQFCQHHQIKYVISASHPFASELHQTAAAIALEIPLIRFERLFPERIIHPLVHYLNDYPQVLKFLEGQEIGSLLVLAGVQSIPKLKQFWTRKTSWFRILDRQESRELAELHGFPTGQLLFGFPQNMAEEIELFLSLKPEAILTKESGFNGKMQDKTAAAIQCGIPILVLKKPELPEVYKIVNEREELLNLLAL